MDDVKSAALRLVLGKRRTEQEVTQALIKKGYQAEQAAEASAYFRMNGYIDHADYARRFSHDAALIKGFGPQRIIRELSLRGIEEEYIDTALAEIEFDIRTPMESRFGNGVRTKKELLRIYNHFLRKGFAPAVIRKAMDALYTYE